MKKLKVPEGMKVTWDANPEVSFTEIEYRIFNYGAFVAATTGHEYVHAGGDHLNQYRVVAYHPPSKLSSPFSLPAESADSLVFVPEGPPTIWSTTPDPKGEETVSITETGVQVNFKGKSASISWPAPPAELVADAEYPWVFQPSWTKHDVDGAALGEANANNVFVGANWALLGFAPRPPIASDPSQVDGSFWMSSGYYFRSSCNCFRRDIEPWSWHKTIHGPDSGGRDYYLVVEIQTARQFSRLFWKYVEKKN